MRRRRLPEDLTAREQEVLKLLRGGLTNEEIAQRLHISVAGAKYHVSQILSKLGVTTREEAAAWQPPERRSLYWKLAWIGGAGALAITGALALVAIQVDRNSIQLESDVLARDSDSKTTEPWSLAAAATPALIEPSRLPISAPGVSVPGILLGEAEPTSGPVANPASEPASEAPVEPTPPPPADPTSPPPAEPTPSPGPSETPASPGSVPARVMSLDMETTGNSYDDVANTMTVGTINSCAASVSGNNAAHNHIAHLVVKNITNVIGWQARLNYDGAKMRPLSVNYAPFTDSNTGQSVSFLNLPLDGGSHRGIVSANDIPAPAAGPQTALIGAIYGGAQNGAVSPDTPPKTPPDDASYSAPSGGVLAAITLRVEAGQAGQPPLIMDLDDGYPNTAGSSLVLFTETGIGQDAIYLGEDALGDGFHGEGATCPAVRAAAPSRYAGFFRPVTTRR